MYTRNTYTGLEDKGQLLPTDTWTLHGLWPDFCNGSYTQYCDLTRQFDPIPSPNTTNGLKNGTAVVPYTGPNIGTFLEPFGRFDLLEYMNTYWIAWLQDNPGFWGHEFSKHATCYSTFNTACYGPLYRKHEEIVDFFETAIKYYKRFPTFEWLEEGCITPSNTTSYTYSNMRDILFEKHGGVPFVGCSGPRYNTTAAGKGSLDNGYTVLSEVWYYQYVSLLRMKLVIGNVCLYLNRLMDAHKKAILFRSMLRRRILPTAQWQKGQSGIMRDRMGPRRGPRFPSERQRLDIAMGVESAGRGE